MRKEASLPVRLDPELNKRLKSVSEKLGITKSALIRMLAKGFVEEFEKSGGRIVMPPEWKGMLTGDPGDGALQVADPSSDWNDTSRSRKKRPKRGKK